MSTCIKSFVSLLIVDKQVSPKSGTLKSPPKGFDTSAISKTYYNLVSKQLNSFLGFFFFLLSPVSVFFLHASLWLLSLAFLVSRLSVFVWVFAFFHLLMIFTERSCPLSYFAFHASVITAA